MSKAATFQRVAAISMRGIMKRKHIERYIMIKRDGETWIINVLNKKV